MPEAHRYLQVLLKNLDSLTWLRIWQLMLMPPDVMRTSRKNHPLIEKCSKAEILRATIIKPSAFLNLTKA
jgi:hypothetical protein